MLPEGRGPGAWLAFAVLPRAHVRLRRGQDREQWVEWAAKAGLLRIELTARILGAPSEQGREEEGPQDTGEEVEWGFSQHRPACWDQRQGREPGPNIKGQTDQNDQDEYDGSPTHRSELALDASAAKPFDAEADIIAWCADRGLPVQVLESMPDGALNLHWLLRHTGTGEELVFRCRAKGHWLTEGFDAEARAMVLAARAGLMVAEVRAVGARAMVTTKVKGTADRQVVIGAAREEAEAKAKAKAKAGAGMRTEVEGSFSGSVVYQLQCLRQNTVVSDTAQLGPGWLTAVIDRYIAAPQGGLSLLDAPNRARGIARAAEAAGLGRVCLNHGDFRTGNLLVSGGRLCGVLDWEFAGYRPEEADIGWMLSSPWRYDRPDLEASGLMNRQALMSAVGQAPTARLARWEGLALVRWAVIARRQDQRQQVPPGTNADEVALLDEAEALVSAA